MFYLLQNPLQELSYILFPLNDLVWLLDDGLMKRPIHLRDNYYFRSLKKKIKKNIKICILCVQQLYFFTIRKLKVNRKLMNSLKILQLSHGYLMQLSLCHYSIPLTHGKSTIRIIMSLSTTFGMITVAIRCFYGCIQRIALTAKEHSMNGIVWKEEQKDIGKDNRMFQVLNYLFSKKQSIDWTN